MKHLFLRGASLFLAAALTLTSSSALSNTLGDKVRAQTTTVAPGITVTDQTLWSESYGDLRAEHYIDYTPNSNISAVVTYGSYVRSRATMDEMAAELEKQGLRVVAGINASFYDMKNGVPVGLVITDGMLRSAIPNYNAIGFRADGSAVVGEPNITITARWTSEVEIDVREQYKDFFAMDPNFIPPFSAQPATKTETRTITMSGFNKVREDNGYYLFSGDFWTTTLNNVSGVDVVLRPADGNQSGHAALPVSGTVTCEVVEVRDSTANNKIPAGCFVLSVNNNSSASLRDPLSALEPGTQVTLTSSIDAEWADVVTAASGLYSLVEDGQVADGLAKSLKPCTAVGLRPDGSMIFYTVDGRQSGYSVGASYPQVAQRLIELGCTSAFAMDGGGSTSFGTTYADFDSFQTINQPSDGSPRAVSVCLFLVSHAQPTGLLDHFYLSAERDVILKGSSTPVHVTGVDSNYHPVAQDGTLYWQSNFGTVSQDENGSYLFTADLSSGEGALTAYSIGAVGEMNVTVVDTLSSLTLSNEETGTALSALAITVDETVDLAVTARYSNLKVACADTDFTWTVDGNVGTVSEDGTFTASSINSEGSLTVSGGGIELTIPVVVTGGTPFVDIKDHWAKDYIVQLYALGITKGFKDESGVTTFLPDQSISRGELFTMVVRMLNTDLAAYEDIELPFADNDTLPDWIVPYIKAAYGLGLLRGDRVDDKLYANISGTVTRETAMVVMGRSLDHVLPADLSGFADSDAISSWALESLQTMVALGVVGGDDNQMLNPGNNALRGEVAKIIIRMLSLP